MVDIFSLKYSDINDDFFYFNRTKTIRTQKRQAPVEIFVSDPVKIIIQKWGNKNTNPENYIFNVFKVGMSAKEKYDIKLLKLRQINGYMGRIGKQLGIEIKLTTYVARHSWATLLITFSY